MHFASQTKSLNYTQWTVCNLCIADGDIYHVFCEESTIVTMAQSYAFCFKQKLAISTKNANNPIVQGKGDFDDIFGKSKIIVIVV